MRKIQLVTSDELEDRMKASLERYELPDYFLYLGQEGSSNWIELEGSEAFPVASTLTDLLEQNVSQITQRFDPHALLVGIGSGDARKEKILLEAMLLRGRPRCHLVDISNEMIDHGQATLWNLPIEKTGFIAFCEDLPRLEPYWDRPIVLCLLGNTFCNFDPGILLTLIYRHLKDTDYFLFDCQVAPDQPEALNQWQRNIEEVYRSSLNVHFNLDPLTRRGLDSNHCEFHLELLAIQTSAGTAFKTCKQIRIQRETTLHFKQDKLRLEAGQTIMMGYTWKYSQSQIKYFLSESGFQIVQSFLSDDEDNLLVLAKRRQK